MAARSTSESNSPRPRRRPATTREERERQVISKAVDLAERQIEEGVASAQVITHYLKLGSSREHLEQEKIRKESHLLDMKREVLESERRVESLFEEALKAFKGYSGQDTSQDDDEDYYED